LKIRISVAYRQKKQVNNASVLSLLAQWYLMRMNRTQGWNLNSSSVFRDQALRYGELALAINPMHAHANTIMGSLEARLNNNFNRALIHHNTAIQSNPSSALNHCFKASASTYQDDDASRSQAVAHAEKAIELSPLDPQLYLYKTVAAASNQFAGNLDAACRFAVESYELNSNRTSNLRTLIAIHVDREEMGLAKKMREKLMRLDPLFTIAGYRRYGPGIQSSFGKHIVENLTLAGVPE